MARSKIAPTLARWLHNAQAGADADAVDLRAMRRELRRFRELHREAEIFAHLVIAAHEKGEQVCLAETNVVWAVNRVREAAGLPRLSSPSTRRGKGAKTP